MLFSRTFACLAGFVVCLAFGSGQGSSAAEQAAQCMANGCGPGGWLGTVVPNKIASCSFKAACDAHDLCYSRCENCGDLFGRPECIGTCEQKKDRKDRCDRDFYDMMVGANGGRKHCVLAAKAYYLAVSYRGCTYFRSTREARFDRESFQTDFEAILQWLEENPDEADQDTAALALTRLSTLNASERNRITSDGRRLAIAEGTAAGPRMSRRIDGATVLLNGINVSGLMIDGKPFELDEVRQKHRELDASGLVQRVLPRE